jgi:hypothetical protein
VTDKALVQVLIYGLAVFDFDRDRSGDLAQVSVHFPTVSMHTKQIGQGILSDDGFVWDFIDTDFSNKTLRLNLAGDLEEAVGLGTFDPDGFPRDQAEARDVRWMLEGRDVGGDVNFDSSKASSRLLLHSGTLETCALVHDPTGDEVCRVRNENGSERFKRSVSEYMVLRLAVDRRDGVKVLRDPGGELVINEIDIEDCEHDPKECVEWKADLYRFIYDIVVRNVPDNLSGNRVMKSVHGNVLRDFFPVNDFTDWEVISPDCELDPNTLEWECTTCKVLVQPKCWSHFLRYFPQSSGLNASVCPFVGYP